MPDGLETRLRELEPDWPATPDLAASVVARLAHATEDGAAASAPRPHSAAPALRRRLALGLAALLLLVPAAALAFPGARDDVLEALGLRHVAVERRPASPPARDPQLGDATTLARAAALAGLRPVVPAALGEPDSVYVLGDVISLVYAREGLLLAQAQGGLDPAVLRKIVHAGDEIRRVTVAGRPGVYLPARHSYLWRDVTGAPVRSGPALVWERDGLVLRLEGASPAADAVRIAATVR